MMEDIAEDDGDVKAAEKLRMSDEKGKRRRTRGRKNSFGDSDDIDRESYDSEQDSYYNEDAYGSDYSGTDDLERDYGKARAKSRGEDENLKDQMITLDDYRGKVRSNSQRRGKYGVTVPRPFKFDMRDQTKSKNIREKKVEEMV